MSTQLRILIVEDSESDAGLMVRRLQQAGYDLKYKRVETAGDMQKALAEDWDLILADYKLPRFSAPAALEILKASGRDLPFIVVSGTIGEEKAVALMKAGANDYVMKDNLTRLVPAVMREIREAGERRERRRAEESLVNSEATLRTVLKGSPTGIGLVVHRIFQWVNDKLLDMLGYSREELIGKKSRILYLSEAEYKRVGRVTNDQIREHGWGGVETQWQRKDGSFMEIYVSTVAVEPGDLSAGVVFTAMDITERKRTQDALQVSLRFLEIGQAQTEIKPLLEAYVSEIKNYTGCEAVGIRVLDTAGGIPYQAYQGFSPQFYEMESPLNIHRDQCMCINVIKGTCDPRLPFYTSGGSFYMNGTSRFLATVSEEDKGSTRNVCNEVGYESVALMPFRRGDEILGLIQVADHREDMVPPHIVEVLEKVGMQLGTAFQKLRAETSLRESEEKYRLVFEKAPLGIMHYDQTGTVTDCNAEFAEIIGAPKEKFIGFNMIRELRDEKMRGAVAASIRGEVGYYEGSYLSVTAGKLTQVRAIYQPIFSAEGKFSGGVSIFEDITERKRVEEEIRAAAHKWQTTFDAIGDAVCLLDRESRILQCNQAMADLVGKPLTEIIGRHCWETMHHTAGPLKNCPMGRAWKGGNRTTMTMPFGDRWLHVTADPILDEAGEVAGGVHILADITRYKRAKAKIKDLNILLTAIKDINEALLRVKNETELFQRTCDLLLSIPDIKFTWIGLVQPDRFAVKPVAWAGHEDGYLANLKATWDESPYGHGVAGTVIKTGQPAVIGDIDTDQGALPWRREAQRRGYASVLGVPLVHEKETLGNLNVYSEKKQAFGKEEVEFLNQVAGDIAVGVRSLRLEQELVQSLIKFQVMMIQTVEAIASVAEMRDPYTAGHQRGVSHLALALAQEMGLPDDRVEGIRVAGFLHDIGKIGVPAEILNKPGKINEFEMNIIKTHPQIGYEILKKIDFPWPVAQIVLQHHERLDGSGYPAGLSGENILQETKILAVADVVEAMAAHRPYRPALGIDNALAEISANKGILYDPEVVEACIRLFQEKNYEFKK